MSLSEELARLQQLRQAGTINDDEFTIAKAKLLRDSPPEAEAQGFAGDRGAVDLESQTRSWAMILHLSLFAGYVVPLGGLIVPILIWQLKKGDLPGLDAHGKVVVNWVISKILYFFLSILLMFVLIGIPMMIGLAIVGVVFPIIGGIKASNGEVWPYPMSLKLIQ